MISNAQLRILFILCLFNYSSASFGEEINIAVAANFKVTLEALKPEFEKHSKHTLVIISASTGQLVQQTSHGAPYDIFLAANTAHPQRLWQQIHKQRELKLDALKTYALGQLVFYSNTPLNVSDSLSEILSAKKYDRISMANPRLAPYGLAAKQTLQCLELYENWKDKIAMGQNVAQAFQYIDSKNVNGGFVAMSQVLDKNLQHIRVIDSQCYQPIKQSALRLNNKASSLEFMDFLDQPKTKDIIQQHGYLRP